MSPHEGCPQTLADSLARRGVEVIVATEPPITPAPYFKRPLRCPHGFNFYTAPTSDQLIAWGTDGAA